MFANAMLRSKVHISWLVHIHSTQQTTLLVTGTTKQGAKAASIIIIISKTGFMCNIANPLQLEKATDDASRESCTKMCGSEKKLLKLHLYFCVFGFSLKTCCKNNDESNVLKIFICHHVMLHAFLFV